MSVTPPCVPCPPEDSAPAVIAALRAGVPLRPLGDADPPAWWALTIDAGDGPESIILSVEDVAEAKEDACRT